MTFEPTLASLQKPVKGAVTLASALKSKSLSSQQTSAVNEALSLKKLTFDMAGPSGVPAARLAVLRSAFRHALADPGTISQASKEGEPLSYTSGTTVTSEVKTAIAQGPTITVYVAK